MNFAERTSVSATSVDPRRQDSRVGAPPCGEGSILNRVYTAVAGNARRLSIDIRETFLLDERSN